jgi:hypothetical protein
MSGMAGPQFSLRRLLYFVTLASVVLGLVVGSARPSLFAHEMLLAAVLIVACALSYEIDRLFGN